MKKLLTLLILSMILISCESEECDSTVANEVKGYIYGLVRVYDQNDNPVPDYPVSIGYQKWWCDGSWAIWAESQGNLDSFGEFDYISPTYSLFNTKDYILIKFTAGTGDNKMEVTEKITYNQMTTFATAEHNFVIQR